jgi:membrane protease subunit HflC
MVLITQFGAPLSVVTDPGLHFKVPLTQQVNYFDKRLLNLDAPSEEVIAQDKKRIVVDAFARWRIVDPLLFYQTLRDQQTAEERLFPLLSSDIRRVLGSQNFAEMLSQRRSELMRNIRDDMDQEGRSFGIRIVDVRIRRADLPPENSEAIYQRMQKERHREAAEYRAEGDETAQRIHARAEREAIVIKAEATRESEILRGQGDAEKTRVLAEAYGQDPNFFAFYRSMQAYKDALPAGNTTVFLSPKSDFFKYFGNAPEK